MTATKLIAKLVIVVFALTFHISTGRSQELTPEDFRVGFFDLDAQFNSIAVHLGKPKRIEKADLDGDIYVGFYYPKLIVFKNNRTGRVSAFHIYDTSLVTDRGLKIGDSKTKIEKLYGKGVVHKRFGDIGPRHYSFLDYSEATEFKLGDYHVVFFTKAQRVVKMVFFTRISMTADDFNLGFLKLGSPLDSIVARLGKPDSTTVSDWGSIGYWYPKIVVWKDDTNNTLFAMDIYDSSFVTARGLRIGDSLAKVERLYRDCDWETREFERIGPYDNTFKDYSEYAVIEQYLILFIREGKLVKILSYIPVWD